jgi:hypothetical protein
LEDVENVIRKLRNREVRYRIKGVLLNFCTQRWVDKKLRD